MLVNTKFLPSPGMHVLKVNKGIFVVKSLKETQLTILLFFSNLIGSMYVLLIYEVVSEKTYALIYFRKVAQQKVRSHATSSMMSQLMRGPGGKIGRAS